MRPLAVGYAALSLIGAGTAVVFGLPYWLSADAGLSDFVAQSQANGPAATLGSDVAVAYLTANVFVWVEGGRRGVRHRWVYLLLNTFVAVAVGLGAFLAVREHIDRPTSDPAPSPALAVLYALLALAGAGTLFVHGIPYLLGPDAGPVDFFRQAFANGPAATLSSDLLVVYAITNLQLAVDGGRNGIAWRWVCAAVATFVATAAGMAVFYAVSERRR